jgi:Ni/Fe-hydrogenase subunit HybB-like protein
MSDYQQSSEDLIAALSPPRRSYKVAVALLALGFLGLVLAWIYQIRTGMGVAGISHPVCWGVYIGSFVFWIGIAHSGTLISAILYLVRSKWRTAISRSAEGMTIVAIMTAGLFPLIHLGRFWVLYYILPYPSERRLWPNFMSPLVLDLCAILTYLTVSVIFFYIGMVPDLAAVRDHLGHSGRQPLRQRFYHWLSLGWHGGAEQWRHYGRSYLFFAALATPLVISVHSVVSWDFAMSLLPGWHTTIFAPYFVAGAIHSGLAMVLALLIPMRKLLHLQRVITIDHFESVAKTILVTTCIIAYAYVIEPFIAWYSGDLFEQQFAWWRSSGAASPIYWALLPLNVLLPLTLFFKKVRRNLWALFFIAIAINLGMWLERVQIITFSTAHDFLPHNWGPYWPRPVEWTITAGATAFFLFLFFSFAKLLPTVAIGDVKELIGEHDVGHDEVPLRGPQPGQVRRATCGVLGVYTSAKAMLRALQSVRLAGFDRVETYAPYRVEEAQHLVAAPRSPVRIWTLVGALSGMIGGFALAIGTSDVNQLITGGKATAAVIIPYCIIAFEGTVLLGTLANLMGIIACCRPGSHKPMPPSYDPRFSRDRFGVFILCDDGQRPAGRAAIEQTSPEEIRELG